MDSSSAALGNGQYVAPLGTTVITPRPGIKIADSTGRILENVKSVEQLEDVLRTGIGPDGNLLTPRNFADLAGYNVTRPGEAGFNYTLLNPNYQNKPLNIFKNSTTTDAPAQLSEFLERNMGCVFWAACMNTHPHFDDLTPYTHQIAPFSFNGVRNIGWLDLTKSFVTNSSLSEVIVKLTLAVSSGGVFQPLVEPIRESPSCAICGELNLKDLSGRSVPKSELWIPADELIFACPIEILHYIEFHKYRPPESFISAVLKLDIRAPFDANSIYRAKLMESGWFNRRR